MLCTQITPFKTIWPNFIIVYPIDSFQDHLTKFCHYVHNWFLSRPFDLILSMCTQLTPFKTIWTDFYTVYPICSIDSFQDILTRFLHFVANWLLSRPYDLIFDCWIYGFIYFLICFKTAGWFYYVFELCFIPLNLFINLVVDNGEFWVVTTLNPGSVQLGGQPKCTEVLHCPLWGNYSYFSVEMVIT